MLFGDLSPSPLRKLFNPPPLQDTMSCQMHQLPCMDLQHGSTNLQYSDVRNCYINNNLYLHYPSHFHPFFVNTWGVTWPIGFQTESPTLFNIWMLRDNTQHLKAPRCCVL